MFRKGNLPGKYKEYTKYIKHIKEKIVSNAKTIQVQRFKPGDDVMKDLYNNNSCIKYKQVLTQIQEKLDKYTKNELADTSKRIQNNIKRLCTTRVMSMAALGVFKSGSDSISVTDSKVVEEVPQPSTNIEAIPEPPEIPDAVAELLSQLNALGEPSLATLGLGGWSPMGLVQEALEFFHVSGMPWWGAIALGTVIVRFAMFPLVIISQRNAAKMNNCLPQMQVLQLKMTEARQSGNQLELARYSQEFMLFMKDKQLNPIKNMLVPLAQMPVFVSIFMGLREMANTPVASLQSGGLFWFADLTVPDQFFILPVITSLTLWATIEIGADGAKLSSQNMQTMRYVLRAMPFVILPFTVNFPGAILCYWVSTNFVSLCQVGFLKIPAVRTYFKIDQLVKHENLPVKQKGFVGGIKESWTNMKISRELEERRRLDQLQFNRAGQGPLVKTYKFDPTKQIAKSASTKSS